jgi:uncharacterized protein (UPF0332 family)
LLTRTKFPPTKHSSVIGQFSLMIKGRGERYAAVAKSFNIGHDARLLADYAVDPKEIVPKAVQILSDASVFIEVCKELIAESTQ